MTLASENLIWISAGGWLIALVGSVGLKTLLEFSRSEVEAYCRRWDNKERFTEILRRHEEVALGAEFLQAVGAVVALTAGLPVYLGEPPLGLVSVLSALGGSLLAWLLFVSWIPWALARVVSGPLLYHTWGWWTSLYALASPVHFGATIVTSIVARLAGRPDPHDENEEQVFEEEMRAIVSQGLGDGVLEEDAREMIEGVMELDESDVGDVMTPRSLVEAIEVEMPWAEMVQFVAETRRTRLPVYENELDNVLGVLYVKDLLAEMAKPNADERKSLRELLRTPRKVVKTAKLDQMLSDFLADRTHLALVVGEFDTVEGVVTMEDILEEIVGEIDDEKDPNLEEIRQLSGGMTVAMGRAHLADLNEALGLSLPEDEDFDTIGGYLMDRFGRMPLVGEHVEIDGVRITVVEASEKVISKVRLDRRTAS